MFLPSHQVYGVRGLMQLYQQRHHLTLSTERLDDFFLLLVDSVVQEFKVSHSILVRTN